MLKGLKYNKFMGNLFKWVDFKLEQPKSNGKYIVSTITPMGNIRKFEANLTITNAKSHFDISNQVVTHWLKKI